MRVGERPSGILNQDQPSGSSERAHRAGSFAQHLEAQMGPAPESTASANAGIETHALPSWMDRYRAPQHDLSVSRAALQETRLGVRGPATEHLRQQTVERLQFASELDEFSSLKKEAYDSSLEQMGLTSAEAHSQQNSVLDQMLHESFREKLLSNPRAEALMQALGIDPT